jgi:exonuclease III
MRMEKVIYNIKRSLVQYCCSESCEDKSDDVKDSFYEEVGRVFDQFPRYDMKILLGDFNAKRDREDIFKPIIGNGSSHDITNDNGVKVVNFAI